MNPVLGLPGRNPETAGWMRALLAEFGVGAAEVVSYAHWQRGGEPDVAQEASDHPVAGRSLVVAKSMGTMVLLASAQQGEPRRAVLIGTPVSAYSKAQTRALQSMIDRLPCLFIQQQDDFTGSAAALQRVLGDGVTVKTVAGSDHVYSDVAELAGLISDWQEGLDG